MRNKEVCNLLNLYTEVQESQEWLEGTQPLSRAAAFLDLLKMLVLQDTYAPAPMRERAVIPTNTAILAEKWRWSKGDAKRFLTDLEYRGFISKWKDPYISGLLNIRIVGWQGFLDPLISDDFYSEDFPCIGDD